MVRDDTNHGKKKEKNFAIARLHLEHNPKLSKPDSAKRLPI
jgi:hypothetical protein